MSEVPALPPHANTDSWRSEIERWAYDYAERLAVGLGREGVAIGGSIARGQHWQHSDLEIGILVDQADPTVTHFSADSGRGVEIFQLESERLASELAKVEGGDLAPIGGWPLQLWRCRVTHDPSGLLSRFAAAFEQHLFSATVLDLKLRTHGQEFDRTLAESRRLLVQGRPRAAMTMARAAMNERILALHWQSGELPRSQNRTDSRFRSLSERYGLESDYQLFRDVFALDSAEAAIRHAWPVCRQQVLTLTELWEGANSREFFTVAVDSDFTWGENAGIVCVYRLYIPRMGGPAHGILGLLDDSNWGRSNEALLRFLGLDTSTEETVAALITRLRETSFARTRIGEPRP